MAGRPQKRPEDLQYRRGGRVERRTFPIVVPDELPPVPPAPRGLKGAGLLVWEAYWGDPVSCAATRVDGYDIARYCLLIAKREAEERKAQREGATIEGVNGPMLNPRYRIIREQTREIEKLREQLGILPLARMRLGLVQTQRDLNRADLLRRLDRHDAASETVGTEATVVNLGELA